MEKCGTWPVPALFLLPLCPSAGCLSMCQAWSSGGRCKGGGWKKEGPDGAGAPGQKGGRGLFFSLCEGKRKEERNLG